MATLSNTQTTSSLADLIAEERRLFRDYDEPDGRMICMLRARIAAFPCSSMDDVNTKARWVAQLLADCDESVDDAIRSEGLTDIGPRQGFAPKLHTGGPMMRGAALRELPI